MAKHAWFIFFALGVGSVLAAFIELSGRPPDPPSPEGTTGLSLDEIGERIPGMSTYVDSLARQLGNFMLAMGVLLASVAAGPFRRGERWAWYVMWVMPLLLAIQFVNSRFGRGWWLDAGLIPVTIAALLATHRQIAESEGTQHSA
jgi:hypothetical protein